MSWIETIKYKEAGKRLKKLYDKVKGPDDNVDNVLMLHSLRPHTLIGHMTLYKAVLHNNRNTLPKWFLEAIGVYVSHLNSCVYCVEHHLTGLKKLTSLKKSTKCMRAIKNDHLELFFLEKHKEGLKYAAKLTNAHKTIVEEDIEVLRKFGYSDGEILEINQVASYFNYVNRMVVGLGASIKGDILGLSPSDTSDSSNWSHT